MIGILTRQELEAGVGRSLDEANSMLQSASAHELKSNNNIKADFINLTKRINYWLAIDDFYYKTIKESKFNIRDGL